MIEINDKNNDSDCDEQNAKQSVAKFKGKCYL
jgi:hypothetical protein